jgi:hypothetical protein
MGHRVGAETFETVAFRFWDDAGSAAPFKALQDHPPGNVKGAMLCCTKSCICSRTSAAG